MKTLTNIFIWVLCIVIISYCWSAKRDLENPDRELLYTPATDSLAILYPPPSDEFPADSAKPQSSMTEPGELGKETITVEINR